MLIAQIDYAQDEGTGDFYYRTFVPGVGMAYWDGIYVVNLVSLHRFRSQVMRDADVLILNNICDADLLPVIRDRKDRGKLTIFEISDDIETPPESSDAWGFYQQSNNLLLLKRLAHYCDAVQFGTPVLESKYRYLNSRTRVFPNQMLIDPFKRPEKTDGKILVGWGGSTGHYRDVANISAHIMRWVMSRSDVNLCLMCNEKIWELFDNLPAGRKRRFPVGSINDYYRFVSHLDIGLAPLEDTPFNRSRSDLKVLEYAVHGAVPVAQAVGPYPLCIEHGRTGFLFNTPGDLVATLDYIASDESVRARVSNSAREYVLRERNSIRHGKSRVEFYRGLIAGESGGRNPPLRGAADIFAELRGCVGAIQTGRHLLLSRTRYELLLEAGELASSLGEHEKARNRFLEAMEMEPLQYMPFLLGASVSGDPVNTLKKALERNPDSLASYIQMGKAYQSNNMYRDALANFKAAAAIFPEYELPYIESAFCLREMGLMAEATRLMRKAVDLIPEAIREKN
ncbi:MAG: glycosyltransferase [Syntrophobacteraceae bacterium]